MAAQVGTKMDVIGCSLCAKGRDRINPYSKEKLNRRGQKMKLLVTIVVSVVLGAAIFQFVMPFLTGGNTLEGAQGKKTMHVICAVTAQFPGLKVTSVSSGGGAPQITQAEINAGIPCAVWLALARGAGLEIIQVRGGSAPSSFTLIDKPAFTR